MASEATKMDVTGNTYIDAGVIKVTDFNYDVIFALGTIFLTLVTETTKMTLKIQITSGPFSLPLLRAGP